MIDTYRLKADWLSNIRGDVLAGLVVALALIPEAIAFSVIAGVDPKVGLYASVCIAITISFTGGRPGMISAATAATALLMIDIVRDHGLQYLLAATVVTGVVQIIFGLLKLGRYMRFVSRAVMTGFVNALAILIFMAQLPELVGVTWETYALCAGALAVIYLFPYVTKAVPSPLVAILSMTVLAVFLDLDVRTVADLGALPETLPIFSLPDIPLTWDTLWTVLPVSVTIAMVGLLESLMTAQVVDDLTDTESNRDRECRGQGLANIVSGFFGGMAGCAMIGQSVINVKSGGRGRLSTLCAGVSLMVLLIALSDWVKLIPMAALVAVMIMVSIGTFSWKSLTDIRVHPISTSLVTLGTVLTTVFTHDLAKGVLVGVLLAALFFARKVARFLRITSTIDAEGRHRVYTVEGQVFFASAEAFSKAFDLKEALEKVTIDLTAAHMWDLSGVGALDKVVLKFRREGAEVVVVGLNEASATIVDKLGVHDKPGAIDTAIGH
jgi:SulP family sulfate permease